MQVGSGVRINARTKIYGSGPIVIGEATWIGISCVLIAPLGSRVVIGPRCDIGPDVLFECGSHQIGGAERRAGEGRAAPISVGAGSWIGARAVLLGGVEIGPGSLVAAGAVVTAGVYPAQSLLAGVPARIVRQLSDTDGSAPK